MSLKLTQNIRKKEKKGTRKSDSTKLLEEARITDEETENKSKTATNSEYTGEKE